MSKPSEYRCQEDVLRLLEKHNLSLPALRLVHACHYYVDQHPRWHLGLMTNAGARNCTVRCTDLIAATGTAGAKDNRMIADGIRDLADKGIFTVLDLSENRRKLTFRFSKSFVNAGTHLKNSRFAMLDTEILAKLRSPAHVMFYSWATMVQRAKFPQFSFRGVGENDPWSNSKRSFLRAAASVGGHLGHGYVIIPELDDFQEYVAFVRVKIVSASSQWSPGMLYPRSSPEAVSIVQNGVARTLTRSELRQRRDWTHI